MGSNEINLNRNYSSEQLFLCDILHKNGAMTISDMCEYAGISRSSLVRLLYPIIATDLLQEAGTSESSGGRKATLYTLNPKKYYSLGIDISSSSVAIVIINMHMETLYSYLLPMKKSCTPMVALMQVYKMFISAIDLCGLNIQDLIGVGIGVTGQYDYETNLITDSSGVLPPEWDGANIREIFSQICTAPVCIGRSVDMAALGEYLAMPRNSRRDLVYVNCGYGIRKGAISGGCIVNQARQTEDAFGHMIIHPNGEFCTCGNRGCIKRYATIPPIIAKYGAYKSRGQINDGTTLPSIYEIFRLADNRDELAVSILVEAATDCGIGLSNLIRILEPEVVVLSGLLVERCDLYYNTCRQVVEGNLVKAVEFEITKPASPWKSIAMGAAGMAIEYLLKNKNTEELLTEQIVPPKKHN